MLKVLQGWGHRGGSGVLFLSLSEGKAILILIIHEKVTSRKGKSSPLLSPQLLHLHFIQLHSSYICEPYSKCITAFPNKILNIVSSVGLNTSFPLGI